MATKHNDSCLKKAGDDEPIFVLRAQDNLAPALVYHWAMLAKTFGCPDEKVSEAVELANKMRIWQQEHGCKIPD